LAQGLVAADPRSQVIYFIGGDMSELVGNVAPNDLYKYDITTGIFSLVTTLVRTGGGQWCALLSTGAITYPLLIVQQIGTGSVFSYQVKFLDAIGGVSAPYGTTPANDTFVNFFWADYDINNDLVYILSGDENTLTELDVALYTFNLQTKAVTSVLVDNKAFTISTIHLDQATGNLYSLSPGLVGAKHAWTLVQINPTSGVVTPRGQVAPSGSYQGDYGGGIYGGFHVSSLILHMLERTDRSIVLVGVDPRTGQIKYSTDIDTGVNNHLKLESVIYVAPSQ